MDEWYSPLNRHGYWYYDECSDDEGDDELEGPGDVYQREMEEALRTEEARVAALPDNIVIMGDASILMVGPPRAPKPGDWGYERPPRRWETKGLR